MSAVLRKQILLTTLVFLTAQFILVLISWTASQSYFTAENWAKWDSYHYISIATNGYQTYPCSEGNDFADTPEAICGNAAWFPAYPLFIRGLNLIYSNPFLWGSILSKLFHWSCLFFVVKILKLNEINKKSILLLFIAASSFGYIYYHAVFPMSLLLVSVFVSFYAYLNKKWWLLFPTTFIAAMTYPTGPLLAHVLAFTILIGHQNSWRWRLSHALIPLSGGGLGLISAFLVIHMEAGSWEAFFDVQSNYRSGASHNTLVNFLSPFKGLAIKRGLRNLIQIQSILVIVGYFILSWQFFKRKWHQHQLYLLSYIYVSFYFLFIWTVGGNLSMYRGESLLLPFVFLLKELPLKYLLRLLLLLFLLGATLSYYYFEGSLI